MKRANPWVYIDEDNGWVNIGQKVADALQRDEREAKRNATYKPEPKHYAKPKAFANPNGRGYGGGQWPFDEALAYMDGRYRAGIRNAIFSHWTDGYWKHEAKLKLTNILATLLAAYEAEDAWEEAQD